MLLHIAPRAPESAGFGTPPGVCHNRSMDDRIDSTGEAIWKGLSRLVRDLVKRRPGGHLIESQLPEFEIRLPFRASGVGADRSAFCRALRRDVERQIDEAIELSAAFRPGHAFCHRCNDATCEHSLPPSSRHVFVRYAPTGLPCWEEFAQFCLAQRHPDVDRLYANPPAFVSLVQDAGTLRADLLESFQVDRQELLGQLTAGFFSLRSQACEGRSILALTIQVTASRSPGGPRRLGLNVLGRTPKGEDLSMLWDRQEDMAWRRGVRWAQEALATIERDVRARGGRKRRSISQPELESRVAGILNGLARRLEQDLRSRQRRTTHADRRHQEGDRPTRSALNDIRVARSAEAFLFDERRGTLVILGDRGRTHFFTREGRLVSSVRYSREAIERKRGAGLWRAASEDETRVIREKLQLPHAGGGRRPDRG